MKKNHEHASYVSMHTQQSSRKPSTNEKQREKKNKWLNIVFICWWRERIRARQRFICNIYIVCVYVTEASQSVLLFEKMANGPDKEQAEWVRAKHKPIATGNRENVKRPRTEWNSFE